MGFLSEFMGGMPALLLICIGITAMIGVVHLWLSRASWDANAWVGIWSGLGCLFLVARGVQLTTQQPEQALLAGKVAISVGPYLVWALIGFGRNLGGRGLDRSMLMGLATMSVVWTLGIMGTPFFVDSEVTTRTDFFGRSHLSVHALWPTHLLSLYFAGALIWGVRRLRKQSQLEPGERRMLAISFSIYAALGIAAVLTSASVISVPAAAEFGPVVVAITLSYLMAQRKRRIEMQLEELLAEKSSRLVESEERYHDLVEHAPIGVFVLDAEGSISALNPRMAKMLGGLGAAESRATLARAGLLETAHRAMANARVERQEHKVRIPVKESVRVWSVTASAFGEDAEVRKALVVADDVTERHELEKQRQQSRKMDSIGRLVAGVAHEINNPMAYVRANLGSIARYKDTVQTEWRCAAGPSEADKLAETFEDLEALVEESIEGVERTIRIVQDMGGLVIPDPSPESPIALAPLLRESLRLHKAARREGVDLVVGPLEEVFVSASATSLRQVFDHLLANAEEAVSGGGRIEVETSVLTAQDGIASDSGEGEREGLLGFPRVRVCITDDGPGVPEEARAHLFDPFFTLRETSSGTGLGLYIAYQTIQGLGGELSCIGPGCDASSRGARFEVILPTT